MNVPNCMYADQSHCGVWPAFLLPRMLFKINSSKIIWRII